jgi:hypothetical protein
MACILEVIEEDFDMSDFSFTTGRKKGAFAVKLSRELQDTRSPEWARICTMVLNKVILFVNGASNPIEIFRK